MDEHDEAWKNYHQLDDEWTKRDGERYENFMEVRKQARAVFNEYLRNITDQYIDG